MRYDRILTEAAAHPWAIEPNKGREIAAILSERAAGGRATDEQIAAAIAARKPKPRGRSRAVALIPIYGVMTHRADWFTEMSGMASTEQLARQVAGAAADPDVEAIVMDIDSPGGSVFGTEELANQVAAATKSKKVIAVANALAASAAYQVASQASELVITPSGMVGSIGVYTMHVDRSEQMKQRGIKVSFVSAGERKTAGNEYEPLSPVAVEEMTEIVQGYYDLFVRFVARGRNVSQKAVREGFGKGGMVLAEPAVREGMADKIATLDEVLARYGTSLAELTATAQADRPDVEIRRRKLLLG